MRTTRRQNGGSARGYPAASRRWRPGHSPMHHRLGCMSIQRRPRDERPVMPRSAVAVAARPLHRARPQGQPGRSASARERSSGIRAWARGQGIAVSDRGRIPPAWSSSTKPPPEDPDAAQTTVSPGLAGPTAEARYCRI